MSKTREEFLEDIKSSRADYDMVIAEYNAKKAGIPKFLAKIETVFQELNGYPLSDLKKKDKKGFKNHPDFEAANAELCKLKYEHKAGVDVQLSEARFWKSRFRKDWNNAVSRYELALENENNKRLRVCGE